MSICQGCMADNLLDGYLYCDEECEYRYYERRKIVSFIRRLRRQIDVHTIDDSHERNVIRRNLLGSIADSIENGDYI